MRLDVWPAGGTMSAVLNQMSFRADQNVNGFVAIVVACIAATFEMGCGGEACGLARYDNTFSIDFTEQIASYEGTVQTGDVWLRSYRKHNLHGEEENAVLLLAEHAEARLVEIACVDGLLTSGNELFGVDCAVGLGWLDGGYVPLHLRIDLFTSSGTASFPANGLGSFETEEVMISEGSCHQAYEVGSIEVETGAL